ncbi:hypothetical protein CYMTET_49716 [Cymbomonas tetramitiformis]|uniref:Chloroplast processing enzyme n=1 Tax=Cymbomonas tetramitiformis TaxID=36881 RepID=A0AAE0BQS2_9CHLO|nr:hypothetical protein CYMTET_49716 [Cymbomonas tetramitiformis]
MSSQGGVGLEKSRQQRLRPQSTSASHLSSVKSSRAFVSKNKRATACRAAKHSFRESLYTRARSTRWIFGPKRLDYWNLNVPRVSGKTAAACRRVLTQASSNDEQVSDEERQQWEELLARPLAEHDDIHRGQLSNGLRYTILQNAVPPNRFEAHLEIHAGSVDEREDEQGIAHLVEHVTFLGSKKRERLLGTGARSNAYTDFHHTVFHVHSPVKSQDGSQMLPQVLEALDDIAFHPAFLSTRIEKERRAVLAEAQMMNTIEYRVDCQLLQQLHWENALGQRFPIGLEKQIKGWQGDMLRKFHERWYFPANATLYLVGNFQESTEEAIALIEKAFGKEPIAREKSETANEEGAIKRRHAVRPPVAHAFGCPLDGLDVPEGSTVAPEAEPFIFQHPLLQQFSLSLFQKIPVRTVTTTEDLRRVFISRVLLSVLQFRVNARYVEDAPCFISIDFDHSDSGREGCAVSTLTITSEAHDWDNAIRVALEEVRHLFTHGITQSELMRYTTALLRDSEQLAQQAGTVPSIDNMDFVMESDALNHTVMDQAQGHDALVDLAPTVTLPDVLELAQELFGYVAEYGMPLEERGSQAICTALVACVPEKASVELPDGQVEEVPFEASVEAIMAALTQKTEVRGASSDVDVPEFLIPQEELSRLLEERQPSFVPPSFQPNVIKGTEGLPDAAEVTGVKLLELSNGVRVNYRRTENEPSAAMVRMVARGGRAMEDLEAGPMGFGSVAVGVRTLSEAGTVGGWEREQVELFCLHHLINCVLEADEEFTAMDFHFAVGEGGMRAVLELLHLILESPRWDPSALDRSKQLYLNHYRAQQKSLERATAAKLMDAMLSRDRRFLDPTPEEVSMLTLDGVRDMVQAQLFGGNLEISIVGDFDEAEVEECVLNFLGTIRSGPPQLTNSSPPEAPIELNLSVPADSPLRRQRLLLQDSDDRACAYVAGPAPNRWGPLPPFTPSAKPGAAGSAPQSSTAATLRRGHPLYTSVSLSLLVEIINSRLFTTVRDALGLTYDVSFELSMFERLANGWFVLSVTSTPQKIDDALAASIRTLRGIGAQQVTQRELDRARRTLLTRHESDLKDNPYWLGLLTHLQSDAVPGKDLNCLRDLPAMYESARVEDIYHAYSGLQLDDGSIFSCVGVAGRNPQAAPDVPPPAPQAAVLQQAVRYGQDAVATTAAAASSSMAAAQQTEGDGQSKDPRVMANAAAAMLAAFQAAGMGNMQKSQDDPPQRPPQ